MAQSWSEYKKNKMNVLNDSELEQIELVATLVARRKELGLSQRELAERCGLHQSAIARMEKDGSIPRIDNLKKVARALGLKVALIDENASTKSFV